MNSRQEQFVKPKRVALYCRVATDDQHNKALENQAQSLRAYAEARGYEIVKIIQERGPGTKMDRSGIRVLYELAGRRAMDEVLATSMSCYVRGTASVLSGFIESLADMGVVAATELEGDLREALPDLIKIT